MADFVDISAELRSERETYVRLRANAARLARILKGHPVGDTMAKQVELVDAAIANIDFALRGPEKG